MVADRRMAGMVVGPSSSSSLRFSSALFSSIFVSPSAPNYDAVD